jgi:hypothetical protein
MTDHFRSWHFRTWRIVRGPIQSDIQAWCNWFCFFFCACVWHPKARVEIEAAKGWHRSATDAMGRVQERPSIAQSRFPRTGQSSFQGSEIESGQPNRVAKTGRSERNAPPCWSILEE